MAVPDNAQSILQLWLDSPSIGVMFVDQKDIENVHVQATQHCVEARIALGHMGVAIDGLECR
jgi:hypothetical protein